MLTKPGRMLALALLLLTSACAGAARKGGDSPGSQSEQFDTLLVDLAQIRPGGTQSIPVEPGAYIIKLAHAAPTGTYSIHVGRTIRDIAPVAAPTIEERAGLAEDTEAIIGAACADLRRATRSLVDEQEETAVRTLRAAVVQNLHGPCNVDAARDSAHAVLDGTTRATTRPVVTPRGVDLQVTVTRLETGRTFTSIFETGDRGQWRTGYGFTFVADPWNTRYYAKSTEKADSFVVTRETQRRWMDFVPTLFYTWMPTEDLTADWSTGATLGLGFDSSRPVVLFGGQRTYNQNLTISIGAALHPQQVLVGRYENGSIVRENLGSEQLHENRYRLSPYFSVSLRSLTNPFSRQDRPDPDAAAPPGARPDS